METEAWENSGSHGVITKFRLIPGNLLFFPSKTVKERYQDQIPPPPARARSRLPEARRGVLFELLLHARTTEDLQSALHGMEVTPAVKSFLYWRCAE